MTAILLIGIATITGMVMATVAADRDATNLSGLASSRMSVNIKAMMVRVGGMYKTRAGYPVTKLTYHLQEIDRQDGFPWRAEIKTPAGTIVHWYNPEGCWSNNIESISELDLVKSK